MSRQTSLKQRAKQALRLLKRNRASELHDDAWVQYDLILRQKTTICTMIFAIYKLILVTLGDWSSKKEMLLDTIGD